MSKCLRLQIRGVPVGSVLSVQPSLEQVNVLVEIKEPTTVIPRNSLIEANQSGLIAESLIDITPQLPIPDYKVGTCTFTNLLYDLNRQSSAVWFFSLPAACLQLACLHSSCDASHCAVCCSIACVVHNLPRLHSSHCFP